MKKRILVAYGTRCGSTAEVAEAVGAQLREAGFEVEVRSARDVNGVEGFDGAVLGSGVRMGRLMPEVRALARRGRAALAKVPVALFAVCLAVKDDTPKNRADAGKYLKPLTGMVTPAATALFAGAFDLSKVNPFFKWIFSKDKSGAFKTVDCRDWNAIRAWAREVGEKFA